jgi:hypothetical protein
VGPAAGRAAGGLGLATGGAGGNSDGSAETRLGPPEGRLGALSVGVFDDGGTLRADAGLVGSEGDGARRGGTLRAGTGLAGTGVARPVRRVWMRWRVATWLSVRGARGEPADGLAIACVRSARLARMRSLEEARGMVTLVGNQEIVSQMRSARVSQIQTLWQRYESIAGPVTIRSHS